MPDAAGTVMPTSLRILVDADACPVKEEIYRVALRHAVPVTIVSNSRIRIPDHPLISRAVVSDAFDAADDWIVENATSASPAGTAGSPVPASPAGSPIIVITADILLADRCLKAGATVLAHNGKPFTLASIGAAVATRAIMADLRAGGEGLLGGPIGGPPPFAKADRSRFLSALDEALVRLLRAQR